MKPCIFVHQGYSMYLDSIFDITRKYNRSNRLILIGDDNNKHIAEKHGMEFFRLSDYEEKIPYYHFSPNGEKYEMFCFKRWFIIKNFCLKHGISDFVHSDSDNAFFVDISTLNYTNARIGKPDQVVVPNVIFMSLNSITQICKYYLYLFSLPIESFISNILPFSEKTGDTIKLYSDMFFLKQAIDTLKLKFETLPESGGSRIFNANFSKYNIVVKNDKLFKENTGSELVNIHFCGSYKLHINNYLVLNKAPTCSSLFSTKITPVIFNYKHSVNIGDEVQTIAAIGFIQSVIDKKYILPYVYINRDDDQKASPKNAEILANVTNPVIFCYGWMSSMTDLSYLKGIPTIILSIHYAGKEDTRDKFCSFLNGRPILTRDTYTQSLIKNTNKNIDCKFGGCLTLFLRPTYSLVEDYTYVVQVESEFSKLYEKYIKDRFPNIISVSQDRPGSNDKIKEANEHLSLIQRAKYVISSRIHTAIPCLAYRKSFSLIKFPNERRLSGFSDLFGKHWIHPNEVNTESLCPGFCGNISKIESLYDINKKHVIDKLTSLLK